MWAAGQGQQGSGSPYSAYGFGELAGGLPLAQALSGGLSTAVVDPVSTVLANPASYPALHRTTFETGIGVRSSTFATATDSRLGRRTEIRGLSLGVPFGNGRWGVALAMQPVSRVNYEISQSAAIPGSSGSANFTYTGDGGLNMATLGAGLVVHQKRDSLANGHRFSAGLNVNYLFGRIETSRAAVFPAGQGFYSTRVSSRSILRDPAADLGLHLQGDLRKRRTKEDKGLYYLAGVAAELPVDVRVRNTSVANTFGFSASGVEVPLDTSYSRDDRSGRLGLPLGLKAGFTVYNEKWTMGVEYRQRDWSTLSVSDESFRPSGQLTSSSTFIVGGSYRPTNEVLASIWKRSVYRAGVRMTNDYLSVGGTQLKDVCITGGLSLPLMAITTRSRLNIGGELGERGTLENGLIRERYVSLLVGITITPDLREGWFKKRRIE